MVLSLTSMTSLEVIMHIWQFQEAKAKLTQLMKEAKIEPQIISKHGINESIVMSISQYEALLGAKESLGIFLRNSPLYNTDWICERDKSGMRNDQIFDDSQDI
jgi:prevent-host-death family protein